MQLKTVSGNSGTLSMSKDEVDGIAKCLFFIDRIQKHRNRDPVFYDTLSEFLVDIRNRFFKII